MIARNPWSRAAHGACLAARPAAEVLPREQDRRALVARLVQHEIRVHPARRVVHPGLARDRVAPGVEQIRAEAGSLDDFRTARDDRGRCRRSRDRVRDHSLRTVIFPSDALWVGRAIAPLRRVFGCAVHFLPEERWIPSPAASMSFEAPESCCSPRTEHGEHEDCQDLLHESLLGFNPAAPQRHSADVDKVPGDCRRPRPFPGLTRCLRPPASLRPSKFLFGRGGAALAPARAGRRSSRGTSSSPARPLETRIAEDAVETFLLRLRLHDPGARHHHGGL